MSHTNSTANYNLPQFVGSDKPAWLTDINSAFSAIDTQMKANNTLAGQADAKGDGVGTLANLTTSAKSNTVVAINEVKATADEASVTAGTAGAKAVANEEAIENLTAYLNINNFADASSPAVQHGEISLCDVKIAKNADGSLAKIYGNVAFTNINATTAKLTFNTALRPSEDITIRGGTIVDFHTGSWTSNSLYVRSKDYTIGTDGKVTLELTGLTVGGYVRISFINSLIFVKSFGDTPEE